MFLQSELLTTSLQLSIIVIVKVNFNHDLYFKLLLLLGIHLELAYLLICMSTVCISATEISIKKKKNVCMDLRLLIA